jgi:hypothetical protein
LLRRQFKKSRSLRRNFQTSGFNDDFLISLSAVNPCGAKNRFLSLQSDPLTNDMKESPLIFQHNATPCEIRVYIN